MGLLLQCRLYVPFLPLSFLLTHTLLSFRLPQIGTSANFPAANPVTVALIDLQMSAMNGIALRQGCGCHPYAGSHTPGADGVAGSRVAPASTSWTCRCRCSTDWGPRCDSPIPCRPPEPRCTGDRADGKDKSDHPQTFQGVDAAHLLSSTQRNSDEHTSSAFNTLAQPEVTWAAILTRTRRDPPDGRRPGRHSNRAVPAAADAPGRSSGRL